MHCYLCGKTKTKRVKGIVRDKPELKILKCTNCGLVFLENFDHINDEYYEKGLMNDFDSLEAYEKSCIDNDRWRVNMWKDKFQEKVVLDFGCGLCGFVKGLGKTSDIFGIDIDPTWKQVNSDLDGSIYSSLEEIENNRFDIITLFHVLEHIKDPINLLKNIEQKIKTSGEIIIEVPNADDALLSLYNSSAFQNFTYWSAHLYLFTAFTLKKVIEKAGYQINYIKQVQRYPISNHLYWLAKGLPGGHKKWYFLDNKEINMWYEAELGKVGKCDTLIASIGRKK